MLLVHDWTLALYTRAGILVFKFTKMEVQVLIKYFQAS